MIGPETYLKQMEAKSYEELLEEKKRLIYEINDFENDSNKKTEFVININPSPEVKYQCNLEYLAKLCALISKKYIEDKLKTK